MEVKSLAGARDAAHLRYVMPAEAGIRPSQWKTYDYRLDWIPAFAGMMELG